MPIDPLECCTFEENAHHKKGFKTKQNKGATRAVSIQLTSSGFTVAAARQLKQQEVTNKDSTSAFILDQFEIT